MASLVLQNAIVQDSNGNPLDIIQFNGKRVNVLLSTNGQVENLGSSPTSILLENALMRIAEGFLVFEKDRTSDRKSFVLNSNSRIVERFNELNTLKVRLHNMATLVINKIEEPNATPVETTTPAETDQPVKPVLRARLVVA